MLYWKIFSLCSENRMKHTNTLGFSMYIFWVYKLVVHKVTTGFREQIPVSIYQKLSRSAAWNC